VELEYSRFSTINIQQLARLENDRITEIKGYRTTSIRIVWTGERLVVSFFLDDEHITKIGIVNVGVGDLSCNFAAVI
jgi:hypothetical protein